MRINGTKNLPLPPLMWGDAWKCSFLCPKCGSLLKRNLSQNALELISIRRLWNCTPPTQKPSPTRIISFLRLRNPKLYIPSFVTIASWVGVDRMNATCTYYPRGVDFFGKFWLDPETERELLFVFFAFGKIPEEKSWERKGTPMPPQGVIKHHPFERESKLMQIYPLRDFSQ